MKKERNRFDDPEAVEIWRKVTKTVKPSGAKNKAAAASAESVKPPLKPSTAKKSRTPAKVPVKAAAPPAKGFDSSTERRMKRGQLDIEGKIDLHGMTQAQAHDALTRFIRAAHAKGKRNVLVITGKGQRSTGGGVLRRLVPLWLEESGRTLACTPAQQKDGGDGALYVRLTKADRTR